MLFKFHFSRKRLRFNGMKKVLLVSIFMFLSLPAVQGKDDHSFYCSDSNNSSFLSTPAGTTHFIWTKNNETLFDRTFTDTYSASRHKYVTFSCKNNLIQYELFDCTEAAVRSYCPAPPEPVSVKLEIDQRRVETSQTLIDGDDYKFITHYLFKSATNDTVQVTGLYFVTDVDQSGTLTENEKQAASQYTYTLMGPTSELVSGVTTDSGKLYFDLSSSPLSIGSTILNFGIAAKPKPALASEGNSSIRWILDSAQGVQGVVASQINQTLSLGEVSVSASRPAIFSRGLSGLKISHFNPQNLIEEPQVTPQAFYRMRVENISADNASQLRRATLEMRVIGMEKKNGALLNASDFSLVEIGADGTVLGVPTNQIFSVADNRNDSKSQSIRIELENFIIPPNESRGLELRIANLVNDSVGKSDDDGAAIQLIGERYENGDKLLLTQLESADWVWTDFSGSVTGGDRDDWRSGFNIDINTRPIIIRE